MSANKNDSTKTSEQSESSVDVEACINVGQELVFDTDINNRKSSRIESTIIGWERDRYILLRLNLGLQNSRTFNTNTKAALRFLLDGKVFALPVFALDQRTSKPNALVHVSWPDKVPYKQVRRDERLTVMIQGTAKLSEGMTVPAEIINISIGGCRVYLPVTLDKDDTFLCSFELPNGGHIDDAECIVRHVRQRAEGTVVGCSYDNIDEGSRRASNFYFATTIERERGMARTEPRILIIEEPDEDVEAAVQQLREEGLDVVKAHSLVKAFTWIGIALPDVLFISAKRSGISVVEICRAVRESGSCKNLPILVYGVNDPASFEGADEVRAERLKVPLSDTTKVMDALQSLGLFDDSEDEPEEDE